MISCLPFGLTLSLLFRRGKNSLKIILPSRVVFIEVGLYVIPISSYSKGWLISINHMMSGSVKAALQLKEHEFILYLLFQSLMHTSNPRISG